MLGFLVSCGARILRGIVGEVSGARQRLQQLFQESSRRFLLPKWVLSVIRIVGQAQILSEFIEAERVFWLVWILQRRILKLSLLPWKKKWKRNIVSQCLPIGNKILFFFFFSFWCLSHARSILYTSATVFASFVYYYCHRHKACTGLILCPTVNTLNSSLSHQPPPPGAEMIFLSSCLAGFDISMVQAGLVLADVLPQ